MTNSEIFIKKIQDRISFWEKQDRTEHEKLLGVSSSILCIIDGITDVEDYKLIINGENISGGLHDLLFTR